MPTTIDKSCPDAVRRWYRTIGSKGGQAGKGTEIRREISKINAKKRWATIKASGGTSWANPNKKRKKPPQHRLPKTKPIRVPGPEAATRIPSIGFK